VSTPLKYLEVTVAEPRKFSLVGYRVVGDSDEAGRRNLVLKKVDASEQAAPPIAVKAPPVKRRVRRTKAQLAAANGRQKTQPTQPVVMPSDDALDEAAGMQKAGD
jgi:K+-transporting ATPase c subunit